VAIGGVIVGVISPCVVLAGRAELGPEDRGPVADITEAPGGLDGGEARLQGKLMLNRRGG
jgi:hypothetical protein